MFFLPVYKINLFISVTTHVKLQLFKTFANQNKKYLNYYKLCKVMKKNLMFLSFLLFTFISSAVVYAHETNELHEENEGIPVGLLKIQEYQQQRALAINFLIAFIAGIISFISPCGFALLPAYFSFLFKERKRATVMTASFGLGLFVSFTILGILSSLIFNFFFSQKQTIAILSGIFITLFGILLLFNINFSFLNFQVKHDSNSNKPSNKSFLSTFLLGFFFGFGWSPCLGAVLGSIIFMSSQFSPVNGILFMGAFALGVTLPLMIVAYFSDRFDLQKFAAKGHLRFRLLGKEIITHVYNIVGGAFLILVGGIMLSYGGTSILERKVTEYTSWSMNALTYVNDKLILSQIFTSTTAKIVGILVVLGMIFWIVKVLRNKKE